MNELRSIVEAYERACARGERAAMATVVGVEGSAYRRPGARMIVTEGGESAGTISGGCLERDVSLRVGQVLETREARIVEYDTRGSEDIIWGLGLGCNGVVRVLLESLHEGSSGARALRFIADCLRERRSGVLGTLMDGNLNAGHGAQKVEIGERLIVDEELNIRGQSFNDATLNARLREDASEVLASGHALLRTYETEDGRAELFFDVITSPRPLVVFGAEHDAVPLVHLARTLGWHITVVDTRARAATKERFVEADEVVPCRAEEVAGRIRLTEETAIVVMTHNYLDDAQLLRVLLPSPARYIGILGPKQRTSMLLEELSGDSFVLDDSQLLKLHGPVGMDIGAETPEEIALSIISEIKAVCAMRDGGFLRDRDAPIHAGRESEPARTNTRIGPFVATHENLLPVACRIS